MMGDYMYYPNVLGHQAGDVATKGCIRYGTIEENEDTLKAGIAGMYAGVTREHDGWARVYVFSPKSSYWVGPYEVLAEEVLEKK